MKLHAGNKNIIPLILYAGLLLPAFSFQHIQPVRKQVTGVWQYISVEANNKSLFSIGPDDTMILSQKGEFSYYIQKPNKSARGTYTVIRANKDSSQLKKALKFIYTDGKARTFYICSLNKNFMCIREGATKFTYKRKSQ